MKIRYFAETDTLYIDLRDEPAAESQEIARDVVADYNKAGEVVGLGIDLASSKVDLESLEVSDLPNVRVSMTPRPAALTGAGTAGKAQP